MLLELRKYLLAVTLLQVHSQSVLKEVNIKLKENGDLQYPSDAPNCNIGERIELISYIYEKRECFSDLICAITHEEQFSPAAKINLYEMCSLEETCSGLKFPFRSESQKNKTDAVLLRYRCLDKSTTFVDICSDTDMPFQKVIHVVSSSNVSNYQMCQCNVQNGEFSVNQRDIRLKIKNERICSPAVVVLNATKRSRLVCNENKNDFGAIFNTVFVQTSSNVSFAISANSKDAFPGMVWLSVEPKGTSNLKCRSVPRQDEQEDETTPEGPGMPIDNKGSELLVLVVIITAILSIISMVLALILGLRTLRRRLPHPRRRPSKDEQPTSQEELSEAKPLGRQRVGRREEQNEIESKLSLNQKISDTSSWEEFVDEQDSQVNQPILYKSVSPPPIRPAK